MYVVVILQRGVATVKSIHATFASAQTYFADYAKFDGEAMRWIQFVGESYDEHAVLIQHGYVSVPGYQQRPDGSGIMDTAEQIEERQKQRRQLAAQHGGSVKRKK